MPWPFRLVDNLSPRGNVEACHGMLFTFKLLASYWGMLFQMFRLIYMYLRRVHVGFLYGTVVCIRLF